MSEELAREIKTLVAKIIKIPEEKITVSANLFTDLGVDSMTGVEILAALDKKYNLDLPEEKLKKVNTLSDLIELVKTMRLLKQ